MIQTRIFAVKSTKKTSAKKYTDKNLEYNQYNKKIKNGALWFLSKNENFNNSLFKLQRKVPYYTNLSILHTDLNSKFYPEYNFNKFDIIVDLINFITSYNKYKREKELTHNLNTLKGLSELEIYVVFYILCIDSKRFNENNYNLKIFSKIIIENNLGYLLQWIWVGDNKSHLHKILARAGMKSEGKNIILWSNYLKSQVRTTSKNWNITKLKQQGLINEITEGFIKKYSKKLLKEGWDKTRLEYRITRRLIYLIIIFSVSYRIGKEIPTRTFVSSYTCYLSRELFNEEEKYKRINKLPQTIELEINILLYVFLTLCIICKITERTAHMPTFLEYVNLDEEVIPEDGRVIPVFHYDIDVDVIRNNKYLNKTKNKLGEIVYKNIRFYVWRVIDPDYFREYIRKFEVKSREINSVISSTPESFSGRNDFYLLDAEVERKIQNIEMCIIIESFHKLKKLFEDGEVLIDRHYFKKDIIMNEFVLSYYLETIERVIKFENKSFHAKYQIDFRGRIYIILAGINYLNSKPFRYNYYIKTNQDNLINKNITIYVLIKFINQFNILGRPLEINIERIKINCLKNYDEYIVICNKYFDDNDLLMREKLNHEDYWFIYSLLSNKIIKSLSVDVKNRGYQQHACLWRDRELGKQIGFDGGSGDIYIAVLEHFTPMFTEYINKHISKYARKIIKSKGILKDNKKIRACIKKSVMIAIYGAGGKLIAKAFLDAMNQEMYGGNKKMRFYPSTKRKVAEILKISISLVCGDLFTKRKAFGNIICERKTKTFNRYNGILIDLSYNRIVKVLSRKIMINKRIVQSKTDIYHPFYYSLKKIGNASYVNLIHSIDARYIKEVILRRSVPVMTIHDCFLVRPRSFPQLLEGLAKGYSIYDNFTIKNVVIRVYIDDEIPDRKEIGWVRADYKLKNLVDGVDSKPTLKRRLGCFTVVYDLDFQILIDLTRENINLNKEIKNVHNYYNSFIN